MNYANEIEFKYQFLSKKQNRRKKYSLCALISVLLLASLYIIALIKIINIFYFTIFIILLSVSFLFFNRKTDSFGFSSKEAIIYKTQNLKNIITSKEYESIQKTFLKLIEELLDYEKINDNDLYYDKNRRKVKEIITYLKDYIYPTLMLKNSDREYGIYFEENKIKLQHILQFLDDLTLSLINETFLDIELNKNDLTHEEIDINSIKESSIIINYKNNILKLYDTSLPFRYIINFLVIFFIVYSINQFFNITNISNILTVSAVAAAGMTRSK